MRGTTGPEPVSNRRMRGGLAASLVAALVAMTCGFTATGAAAAATDRDQPARTPGIPPVGEGSLDPVEGGGFPTITGPTALLTDVRTARQDGFDRIVLQFGSGQMPGYRVAYVEPPVRAAGSGQVVPIAGQAFLQVSTTPASGVDLSGPQPRPTYPGPERVAPPDGEVVTEVVRTGDFEAGLTWTAGVTKRLPFAVAAFADPNRLVVDVLHEPADPGLRPIGEADVQPSSAAGSGPPVVVTDVRLGAHDGFDRLVFETAGEGRAGWEAGYVEQPRAQGSGAPIAVDAPAALGVTLTNIALPGDAPPGTQPWDGPQRQRIADAQVLLELVEDGLFEGRYAFFAGTPGERPFAIGRLDSPSRIVVDILTREPGAPGHPGC